jgi:hypothetical protein
MSSITSRINAGPLDPRLRALVSASRNRTEVPLSVKRFAEESGTDSPSTAIKLAADLLLAAYAEGSHEVRPPIEVERLCHLCGAELEGGRPKARASNAYSTDNVKPRLGHTGKLYLDQSKVTIRIPQDIDHSTARISVAHEIGHLLIHRRGSTYDEATIRLRSSPEEEALAEYCARLLLMPSTLWLPPLSSGNLSEYAIARASSMRVTVHSAVVRFGDPDVPSAGVRGAILWRINPEVSSLEPIHARLTPQWHLCPESFVPVRKSKARLGSLVAELAASGNVAGESRYEEVNIGTFNGYFRTDAFAWGSIQDGTRLVLSLFVEP